MQENKLIGKTNKKNGTENENLNQKEIPVHLSNHKSSNSVEMKNIKLLMEKFYVINLIIKGPSINRLLFKKDNISLKSRSMPKSEVRFIKFRDFIIERDKNEIVNNIKIKKYDNIIINNQTLNIKKKNSLKGEEKDFLLDEKSINQKDEISNDILDNFNKNLNTNQIYGSGNPFEEDDDDNDDDNENIILDNFREGNNIQFLGGPFWEKNNENSSFSSNDDKTGGKNEKQKKKKDSILDDSISISENEENYFKNKTNFFSSPKQKKEHSNNKSLSSDSKSDHYNNIMPYSKESINNNKNSPNKNFLLEDLINKNNIRKNESFSSNSNYENEQIEEDDYAEIEKKIINNLNINDSFISHNNSIIINNKNNNNYKDDNSNNYIMNKNYYNLNNNMLNINYNNKDDLIKNIPNNNSSLNNNNTTKNSINNSNFLNQNNKVDFPVRNIPLNKIYYNDNFFVGNEQSNINLNANISTNNFNKEILNNNYPQNNSINKSIPNILNNKNFNNYQGYNMITGQGFDFNNYIINNSNQISSIQLNQFRGNNNLMNDMNMNNNPNIFILNNSNNFHRNINNSPNFNNNLNYLNNNNIHNNLNSNINSINNNFNNLYNSNNLFNLNIREDIQNINLDINKLNYNNSQNNFNNDINNNKKNFNNGNKYFKNTSQNDNFNNYQNNIFFNQNMINANNSNNQNYKNQYLLNNYINQKKHLNLNDNINQNNINPFNNRRNINNSTIPNINSNINSKLNTNSNVNNFKNNNINYIYNYERIKSTGNINNIRLNNKNNNLIINSNLNKKNIYLPNKQIKIKLDKLSNEELAKNLHELGKNQKYCIYLQKKIENNPKSLPTLFYPNALSHILELSNDQFGNYLISSIIKNLPEDLINKFIKGIPISRVGTNQYGTKVLQTLIDYLGNDKNLLLFIEKMLPHLVTLINDLNGIHIVQKLINIKSKHIQLIYNNIFQNIKLIAITREGIRFIKILLAILDEKNLNSLINSINDNLEDIITNQYGNFIIQEIIWKDNLSLKYLVIDNIIKNIVNFSNHKFSSNIIEKCIDIEESKEKAIDEILKNDNFEKILLNEYGNYVIQKALNKSDQNKQQIMLNSIVPLVTKLQGLPYGQKLLSKLFISYPKLSIYIINSEV